MVQHVLPRLLADCLSTELATCHGSLLALGHVLRGLYLGLRHRDDKNGPDEEQMGKSDDDVLLPALIGDCYEQQRRYWLSLLGQDLLEQVLGVVCAGVYSACGFFALILSDWMFHSNFYIGFC